VRSDPVTAGKEREKKRTAPQLSNCQKKTIEKYALFLSKPSSSLLI